MINQKLDLTLEQYNERKARLEKIIYELLPNNSEELKRAKSQGDLSENAEYDAAKEQQALLNKEKTDLERLLNNARIIQQNESNEQVELGHSVKIKWEDGKTETVKILGYGNGKTEISYDSPLGKALFKRKINDKIIFEAPKGRLQVTILSIN